MRHTLSTVITALLLGSASLVPDNADAASCCGGGSAAALSVPKYAKAVADLSLDTELYDGYWDAKGNYRHDPPSSDLKQYRLTAGAGYRFAKDWQTSISVPYIFNDNVYSGISSKSDGIGDTTLSITYELLDDKSAWRVYELKDMVPAVSIGLSLLLPTGISPYDDKQSSFDITGRGFYRLDTNLLVEKTLRPFNFSLALGYGTYFERSVNREYGKYVEPYRKELGDRFNASLATGYTFVLGSGGDSLTGTLNYAYLKENDASYNGTQDEGSGFYKKSIGAAVSYSSTDHNWSFRAAWNHAIKKDDWGGNFPATDIFSVGVRYVFL